MGQIYTMPKMSLVLQNLVTDGFPVCQWVSSGNTITRKLGCDSDNVFMAFFFENNFIYEIYARMGPFNTARGFSVSSGSDEMSTINYVSTDSIELGVDGACTFSANTSTQQSNFVSLVDAYNNRTAAYNALRSALPINNITYRLVNCSAPFAPQSAVSGSTVNVNLQFPEGFGIINPENDVYVTNNGARIPSTYNNGLLVFTMP